MGHKNVKKICKKTPLFKAMTDCRATKGEDVVLLFKFIKRTWKWWSTDKKQSLLSHFVTSTKEFYIYADFLNAQNVQWCMWFYLLNKFLLIGG